MNAVEDYHGVPIGRRIHVTGNSCSGKSTVGAGLAAVLGVPLVELDALNWQPGWVGLADTNPVELERRIAHATAGEGWVVAGSYMSFSQRIFWPHVETVVWLDPPMYRLLWRVLARSWRRWRSKELLWGTNYERFWPQLRVWNREDSLVWWIATRHREKRRRLEACMQDPDWRHIAFLRFGSNAEIEAFSRAMTGTEKEAGT